MTTGPTIDRSDALGADAAHDAAITTGRTGGGTGPGDLDGHRVGAGLHLPLRERTRPTELVARGPDYHPAVVGFTHGVRDGVAAVVVNSAPAGSVPEATAGPTVYATSAVVHAVCETWPPSARVTPMSASVHPEGPEFLRSVLDIDSERR